MNHLNHSFLSERRQNRHLATIHLGIFVPKAAAQSELLAVLQEKIVSPLLEQQLLVEFRVVSLSPPTFIAEDSTVAFFEFVVPPHTWQVTDDELQKWQQAFKPCAKIFIIPANSVCMNGFHDPAQSRMMLDRVAELKCSKVNRHKEDTCWLKNCVCVTLMTINLT